VRWLSGSSKQHVLPTCGLFATAGRVVIVQARTRGKIFPHLWDHLAPEVIEGRRLGTMRGMTRCLRRSRFRLARRPPTPRQVYEKLVLPMMVLLSALQISSFLPQVQIPLRYKARASRLLQETKESSACRPSRMLHSPTAISQQPQPPVILHEITRPKSLRHPKAAAEPDKIQARRATSESGCVWGMQQPTETIKIARPAEITEESFTRSSLQQSS
jgi:hypothetical protein